MRRCAFMISYSPRASFLSSAPLFFLATHSILRTWLMSEILFGFVGGVSRPSGCSQMRTRSSGQGTRSINFKMDSLHFLELRRPRRERPAQRRDGSGERVGTSFCPYHWTSTQNSIWPGVAESAGMTLLLTETHTGPPSVKLPRKYRPVNV